MNGVYTAINPKAGLRNTYDALNAMKQLEAAGLTNKAQMIKNNLANGRNTLLPDFGTRDIREMTTHRSNWMNDIGDYSHEMLLPDLGQDDILRAYFQTKPRGTW